MRSRYHLSAWPMLGALTGFIVLTLSKGYRGMNAMTAVAADAVMVALFAWYLLAARYSQGTTTSCAFVSTNSIMQGNTSWIKAVRYSLRSSMGNQWASFTTRMKK